MIKLGIPEREAKFAMQRGVLDLITVVPGDDLNPRGVNYNASMIYDFCAQLYGKTSDEYKESEQPWMNSGGISLFFLSFVSFCMCV